MRQRLDQEMVSRGLVPSRARARDLIRRGVVYISGAIAGKPAQTVASDMKIEILDANHRYVSRGALKLDAALQAFAFNVHGRTAVDIGASTGGFTEVLLQAGAEKVYAVDVGRGQLAASLQNHPRVEKLEKTDARTLTRAEIKDQIEVIVADVSFISLTKVLPGVMAMAEPGCLLAALIKPQFEVGPEKVGKGGIVRDEAALRSACDDVRAWLSAQSGWTVVDVVPSPITGGAGNREFLIGARNDG